MLNSIMLNRITVDKVENLLRAKFGTQVKRAKTKKGLELRICCPFCTSRGNTRDTGYKLWINPGKDVYRCWRCETRGSLSELLGQRIDGVGSLQAEAPAVGTLASCETLPGELIRLDHLDNDHVASRYMRHRGFEPSGLGKHYGVSYCASGRLFGGRSFRFDTGNTIVFPIWMLGKMVGWQCRLMYNPDELDDETCRAFGFIWDEEKEKWLRPPKYFTSPGLTKGCVLYNYDTAIKSDVVVVTEGPTDALATGPCAVGTLGKGVSDTQVELLANNWKVIVVLLDPDAYADAEALCAHIGRKNPLTVLVRLENYDDPGSAPTREIWKQIYRAGMRTGIDITQYSLGPHWCNEVIRS